MLDTLAGVAALFLLFITLSISYSIFARATGFPYPVWVVQFNEYSLLWMTFLGAAWVLRRDKHVSIDLVTRLLNSRAKVILEIAHGITGMVVCGVLFWYSASVTWGQFQRGVTDVQAVDVPKYLVLLVIPLGFLLLILQFARKVFESYERIGRGHDQPPVGTYDSSSMASDITESLPDKVEH